MTLPGKSTEHIKHNYMALVVKVKEGDVVFSLILLEKRKEGFEEGLKDTADHQLPEQLASRTGICFFYDYGTLSEGQ